MCTGLSAGDSPARSHTFFQKCTKVSPHCLYSLPGQKPILPTRFQVHSQIRPNNVDKREQMWACTRGFEGEWRSGPSLNLSARGWVHKDCSKDGYFEASIEADAQASEVFTPEKSLIIMKPQWHFQVIAVVHLSAKSLLTENKQNNEHCTRKTNKIMKLSWCLLFAGLPWLPSKWKPESFPFRSFWIVYEIVTGLRESRLSFICNYNLLLSLIWLAWFMEILVHTDGDWCACAHSPCLLP